MRNTEDFSYETKPSKASTKSIIFIVSKDEWEATGKPMNALYVLQYAKMHLLS